MYLYNTHFGRRVILEKRLSIRILISFSFVVRTAVYFPPIFIDHRKVIRQFYSIIKKCRLQVVVQIFKSYAFAYRLVTGTVNHLQCNFIEQDPLIHIPILNCIEQRFRCFRNRISTMSARNHHLGQLRRLVSHYFQFKVRHYSSIRWFHRKSLCLLNQIISLHRRGSGQRFPFRFSNIFPQPTVGFRKFHIFWYLIQAITHRVIKLFFAHLHHCLYITYL